MSQTEVIKRMRHTTYKTLKQAYLGDVNHQELREAERRERDPFIHRAIQLVSDRVDIMVPWDKKRFTTEFRSAPARERLDETTFTFLLRLTALIKEEAFLRTYRKPETYSVIYAWISMLKECVHCILTLLYNVQWTSERFMALDFVLLELIHEGKVSALRSFMKDVLGITLASTGLTEAERLFPTLGHLNIGQFGSSFWRMLHWMAEAIDVVKSETNPDISLAKTNWRKLVTTSLYRVLRCPICQKHMFALMEELKSKINDETARQSLIWFDIHNKVNSLVFPSSQPVYSEENYEVDARFMREALPK